MVDAGKISLFSPFSQSSHGSSGNPPSPPPRRKRSDSSNRGHEVDHDTTRTRMTTTMEEVAVEAEVGEARDTVAVEAGVGSARPGTSAGGSS